jgi:hypothetical protein
MITPTTSSAIMTTMKEPAIILVINGSVFVSRALYKSYSSSSSLTPSSFRRLSVSFPKSADENRECTGRRKDCVPVDLHWHAAVKPEATAAKQAKSRMGIDVIVQVLIFGVTVNSYHATRCSAKQDQPLINMLLSIPALLVPVDRKTSSLSYHWRFFPTVLGTGSVRNCVVVTCDCR